jgi:hypothetical protein
MGKGARKERRAHGPLAKAAVADAHIGRPSARLKADLAAEATTLAQSFFRHVTHTRNVHSKAAGNMLETGGSAVSPRRFVLPGPSGLSNQEEEETRSDRAIITPARHRTLILVKVP